MAIAVAITLRGEKGSVEYSRHHGVVAELHARAHQRLVDRVATVLSGSELELFYSIVAPGKLNVQTGGSISTMKRCSNA